MQNSNLIPIELSVVTPVYQAEKFITEFYRRMSAAATNVTPNYEIICVNDGSTDRSLEMLVSLHEKDPRVVVIDLSRNFGQQNALRTGLAYATGKLVFTIDDDLEEEPEWLGTFNQARQEQQVDVVFGVQEKRRGGLYQRSWGILFYFAIHKLFHIDCPLNIVTARLMTRQYVNALLAHKERNFDISIIGKAIGFRQAIVPITKHFSGTSTYSFRKLVQNFEGFVTAGSTTPLRWIIVTGGICMFIACLLFLEPLRAGVRHGFLYEKLLLQSLWLIGGAILTALGIIGIYVANIFQQVKERPAVVVRAVWPANAEPNAISNINVVL